MRSATAPEPYGGLRTHSPGLAGGRASGAAACATGTSRAEPDDRWAVFSVPREPGFSAAAAPSRAPIAALARNVVPVLPAGGAGLALRSSPGRTREHRLSTLAAPGDPGHRRSSTFGSCARGGRHRRPVSPVAPLRAAHALSRRRALRPPLAPVRGGHQETPRCGHQQAGVCGRHRDIRSGTARDALKGRRPVRERHL